MKTNTHHTLDFLPTPEIDIVTDGRAQAKLSEAECILDYKFTNKALGLEAIFVAPNVHFSTFVQLQCRDTHNRIKTNAALATIGYHTLNLILLRLFKPTGMCKKDFDYSIHQKLAASHYLIFIGRKLGLDRCLITHPPDAELHHRAVADTVEALIGAIVLESDIDAAERVVLTMGIVTEDIIVEENLCNTRLPLCDLAKSAHYFDEQIDWRKRQVERLVEDFHIRR